MPVPAKPCIEWARTHIFRAPQQKLVWIHVAVPSSFKFFLAYREYLRQTSGVSVLFFDFSAKLGLSINSEIPDRFGIFPTY